jgi:hypothetical protein
MRDARIAIRTNCLQFLSLQVLTWSQSPPKRILSLTIKMHALYDIHIEYYIILPYCPTPPSTVCHLPKNCQFKSHTTSHTIWVTRSESHESYVSHGKCKWTKGGGGGMTHCPGKNMKGHFVSDLGSKLLTSMCHNYEMPVLELMATVFSPPLQAAKMGYF